MEILASLAARYTKNLSAAKSLCPPSLRAPTCPKIQKRARICCRFVEASPPPPHKNTKTRGGGRYFSGVPLPLLPPPRPPKHKNTKNEAQEPQPPLLPLQKCKNARSPRAPYKNTNIRSHPPNFSQLSHSQHTPHNPYTKTQKRDFFFVLHLLGETDKEREREE